MRGGQQEKGRRSESSKSSTRRSSCSIFYTASFPNHSLCGVCASGQCKAPQEATSPARRFCRRKRECAILLPWRCGEMQRAGRRQLSVVNLLVFLPFAAFCGRCLVVGLPSRLLLLNVRLIRPLSSRVVIPLLVLVMHLLLLPVALLRLLAVVSWNVRLA